MNHVHLIGHIQHPPMISRETGEVPTAFFQLCVGSSPVTGEGSFLPPAVVHRVRCIGEKHIEAMRALSFGINVEIIGTLSNNTYVSKGIRQAFSDILINDEVGMVKLLEAEEGLKAS